MYIAEMCSTIWHSKPYYLFSLLTSARSNRASRYSIALLKKSKSLKCASEERTLVTGFVSRISMFS